MAYTLGQVARLSVVFAIDGTATDPTGVTARVGDSAGSPDTYVYGTDAELVKDSTGHYHLDLTPDTAGRWLIIWTATGTVEAVNEYEFDVEPSSAPWSSTAAPVYATLGQLKTALRIGPNDDADDPGLRRALQSASRYLDQQTKRRFYASSSETRYFTADNGSVDLTIPDAVTVTAIAIDTDGNRTYETTLSSSLDYRPRRDSRFPAGPYVRVALDRVNGRYSWPTHEDGIAITGTWGFNATGSVPDEIRQACLLKAAADWKGPVTSADGMVENTAGGAITTIKTDNRIAELIDPFIRRWYIV